MATNVQTPFQSTRKRRILTRHSTVKRSKFEKAPLSEQEEKNLLKKTWLTYRCSPLHRFITKEQSLAQYSGLLSATYVANKHKKVGIGLDEEDAPTKAIFSVVKGLAVGPDESHGVKLSVFTIERKIVFEVYLCSVNADSLIDNVYEQAHTLFPGMKETVHEQFTVFPLVLCKGNIGPRKIFFDWLQTEFDCNIARLDYSSLSLSWMLAMWCNLSVNDNTTAPSKIVWSFPSETGIDCVEITFEAESLFSLWKAARISSSNEIEIAEVEKFMQGMKEHLTQQFKIKFNALPIRQIHLEIVHLHMEGKIKMFSKGHVHTVLSHLTSLAIEKMQWKP